MRSQVAASAIRKQFFVMLDRLPMDGPVEVTRHGRVVAVIHPPPKVVRTKKPKVDPRRVARVCKKHHIRRLALFGSILRDDFGPDSDVDLLYDPEPGHGTSLREYARAVDAFTALFGRRVDFVKRSVIEQSHNEIRKHSILDGAKVIYEARR